MSARPEGYARSIAFRILWTIGGAAFLSLVVIKGLDADGIQVPYPIVVLFLAALVAPFVLARWVEDQGIPTTLLTDPVTDRSFPEADDAVRVAVSRWDLRLEYRNEDAFRARALTDLIVDRLRLVHGVDLAAEPERVRALVGPRLWAVLNEPPRSMSPQVLAGLLAEMEAL